MTIEHTNNDDGNDSEARFNDTLLINFCKSLQNLGEESVGDLLMGSFQLTSSCWPHTAVKPLEYQDQR